MKKQLIAIGLASVLTAPSVALADATVYGSFRTGLVFESGDGAGDATVADVYSRFGIKGSSEVSEGLTASFKLENAFNTATGSLGGGRYGSVGLSGGFGSIVLGQSDAASANHFGYVVNPTLSYGVAGGANGRAGRMVSYSSSVGAVSFQIDRHTESEADGGAATVEFGASTSAGPVNVGFAYWGKEDSPDDVVTTYTTTTTYKEISYSVVGADGKTKEEINGVLTVTAIDGKVETAELTKKGDKKVGGKDVYEPVENATFEYPYKLGRADTEEIAVDQETTKNPKTSFTGFVVSSSLAGMNLTVGVGSKDHGIVDDKATKDVDESQTDVSIVALSGSVGDSGVSYVVQMSNSDKTAAGDPSTSVVNLTSSLGGGASLIFEHVSRKGKLKDASLVALKVDF